MGRTMLIVVAAWLAAVAAACGRKGFEGADAGPTPDAATSRDAPPPTTCGDDTCEGNAGELCNSCESDCNTMSIVCGNGACDGGEDAASCYADCGPSPWPWTAEETELATLINDTRTGGFRCPGSGGPVTRPALAMQPAMLPGAREWVWEIAHQNYWMADGSSCNGRTGSQRGVAGGFTDYVSSYGFADVAAAFADWTGNQAICDLLMSDVFTEMNVAVASDLQAGYIFVIK